jgi:tetrahydromethanopterin:alpha-L-glutamate ligase
VVFEVSAFGGFRGAKEGIGIDAAALYCDYVLEKLGANQ